MEKVSVNRVEKIETKFQLRLNQEELLFFLKGVVPKDATEIKVFVKVPGDADCSNVELEIGEDVSLIVEWKVKSISHKRVELRIPKTKGKR